MTIRIQRHTALLIFAGALLIGGVGGMFLAQHRAQTLDPFTGAVIGMAVATAAVTCLLVLEPALILTIGMMLSVFSGWWGQMGIPIPLDRVAIACGIATALVRSIRAGEGPRIRAVHWVMLALLLYAIASAAWVHTLTQHGPQFALLDRLGVIPFLLFLVAPVAFRTPEQRRILALGLVILGAYLGITALLEAAGAHSLVFPSYINNPNLGITAERSRGPFLESGADGLAMFYCMVAGALLLPSFRDRPWMRSLVIGVMVVCAAGIVCTVTRQIWIGASLGAAVAMLFDRRLRRMLPFAAVGAALVVVLALAFVPGLSAKLHSRVNTQTSIWDRLSSDGAALRMAEARPGLGFGWGEFGARSKPYYRLGATYPLLPSIAEAHNVPLSNAAELGFVGVALWAVVLIMGLVAPTIGRAPPAVHPWRLALIAVVIAWFVQANFSPMDYAFDNYLVWLWAGIVVGGRQRPAAARESAVATRVTSVAAESPPAAALPA